MSLNQEISELLDSSNFDAIEEAWLTHLSDHPDDLRYFNTVIKTVIQKGSGDRARFLLELLDDHLSEAKQWSLRLEMLRVHGTTLLDNADLHETIIQTLTEIHSHKPSFATLVEKVGLDKAKEDIPKTWTKADRLATLLTYDAGAIVYMEGKGAGKVQGVNLVLESFKIDFEQHPGLLVGFRAAGKLLSPLGERHFLRRKLEEPETLEALRDSDPPELLRLLLESYDQPRTGAEIKRDLSGIVADSKWSSWWAAARKHPQVIAEAKGKRTYSWAASTEDAYGAVWAAFETAEPRVRLDMLRRDGAKDRGLKERMAESLAALGEKAAAGDPGLACEIWLGLQRAGVSVTETAWSPNRLVRGSNDPKALLSGIHDRVRREKVYKIVHGEREDWAEIFVTMLWKEGDSRALDYLASELTEATPELFDSFFEQILSAPKKSPAAFTWLAERSAEREEWLAKSPLRLLKQILWANATDDFASFRTRLGHLGESGGTLPRLLSHLSEEQAVQVAEILGKTAGLQDYQRQPLINALALRFPSLRQDEEAHLYALPDSIKAKQLELKTLAEEELPANRQAIEEARALGDLRENFEYKAARQRHEYLSARASALSKDLTRVRPIDPTQVDGSEVVIGSKVTLAGEGPMGEIIVLGPWESSPEDNILSNESEIAQQLLGSKSGMEITLAGDTYTIEKIEPHKL